MLIPSVRKIHNHNSHKVIGLSYSYKMNGLIPWESTLERDWLLHLEAMPAVLEIYSQPQTIDFSHDGKWHRYTPDFEVRWRDHDRLPTLYEVKPHSVAADLDFIATSKSIGLTLAQQGYEFVVVDSKAIRNGHLLQNLNFLKHYATAFVTQRDRERLAIYLHHHPICSLFRLAVRAGSKTLGMPELYHLLWEGWLEYDTREKVSSLLSVHLSEGAKI